MKNMLLGIKYVSNKTMCQLIVDLYHKYIGSVFHRTHYQLLLTRDSPRENSVVLIEALDKHKESRDDC